MYRIGMTRLAVSGAAILALLTGCKTHMPHAITWPVGGDVQYTHAKPPQGGYHKNWDPFACTLEVTPVHALNPVRTQHVMVATVLDKDGKPLPNRRVEWMVAEGGVGEIVEVDESGWRASRGYKVSNRYAVSHTNNSRHVLTMGTEDPADDVQLGVGQTWCAITSPIEGESYVIAYAPGIYDWNRHKVFVTKIWSDVKWAFPPPATNPTGTTHEFGTVVSRYSDGTPLAGYAVTYTIVDGPDAVLVPGNGKTATVTTDASGIGKVTIKQVKPAEGTNNLRIDIVRPEEKTCCKPAAHIAVGQTAKTWIGPKISCNKTSPPQVLAGQPFDVRIAVTNPSQVAARNVVVADTLPAGLALVGSQPNAEASGQALRWSLGTVEGGETKTVVLQVKAAKTGRYENTAQVTADQGLTSRCSSVTVAASPQLAIEKTCPPAVTPCDPIEHVIVVRNAGDAPARNVKIVDSLPDGLVAANGRPATFTIGDLGPGQSKQVRLALKATKTGRFENKVTATADGGLQAEASCTTVVTRPELKVEKTGPKQRFVGRPANYEITVTNAGDAAARDTVLVDPLPAGVEFVSATDGGTLANGRVSWRLGTLEPNASRKVGLVLKATRAGDVKNTATATAFCSEASASTDMQIRGVPAILLETRDDPDPIEVGGQTTYTVSITNQGTAEDLNVKLVCTLPPEEEYVSSNGPTRGSVNGQVVTFAPIPTLAPKAKATYTLVIKGKKAADVRFRATLTSDMITTPVEHTESTHIYE